MQPLSPLAARVESEPNLELLRRHGWAVNSYSGSYCVAFRGSDEVVLHWTNGGWQRVGGRGGVEDV